MSELLPAIESITPSDWEVSESKNPNSASHIFEWTENGERVGGLIIEVYPGIMTFLGLETLVEGQNIFRGLCKVLPVWALNNGVERFVVPYASSEQMRQLLEDAGFRHMGAWTWESNVRESDAVVTYGNSTD